MFRNYLLVAIRNIQRQKLFSFINILGLSIGIALSLLISLFIKDEYSFDKFHPDHEKIFRVSMLENYPDGRNFFSTFTSQILGPTLKDNFPQIKDILRMGNESAIVIHDESNYQENILNAEPVFFTDLGFPLMSGDPFSVLDDLNNLIITENYVTKYFPNENPIGKTLRIRIGENEEDYVITGVAQNPPIHSTIQFNMVIPFENFIRNTPEKARSNFFNVNIVTYAFLEEPQKSKDIESNFDALFKKLFPDFDGTVTVKLQPISTLRLDTSYPGAASDPLYSYILGGLALMVILIAIINFVTLSVGKSVDRVKEVGIRKVMGAARAQLVRQFWGEAIIFSLISLFLGLILADAALPQFNTLAGKRIPNVFNQDMIWISILLVIVVGFFAGFYPSVFLSKFNPVEVLKGKMKVTDAGLMRKTLVVFQFIISISLIVGSLAMNKQLKYMQSKNLGFYRDQVIAIHTGVGEANSLPLAERFKNKIIGRDDISSISTSFFAMGQGWGSGSFIDVDDMYRAISFNVIDAEFINTMGIALSSGRNFYENNEGDINGSIIVNEALVREFGWDDPIGRSLPGKNFQPHQIVGVVKDFHYSSLREEIKPLTLAMSPGHLSGFEDINFSTSPARKITVKANSDDLISFLKDIEMVWKEISQGQEFNYFFIDQALDNQYQAETRISNIMDYSSLFAMLIACLGLFSLATLIIKKRLKEIGIRKVLGASDLKIAQMFSYEIMKLIFTAFIISIPFTLYLMGKWMEGFVYRTDIGWKIYIIAGFSTLIIALLTIGYQAIKASLSNPVDTLRSGE
ncbi:MAG TPA: ABC transporter permease [Saprospiraceae bacterium]|nr:ABC transporter permease [Saprospiraceae bacterium]